MSTTDFRALHRLHLVDAAITEIRKRAAALDPGKKILAEIAKLEAQYEETGGQYKALHGEQADLELQQKTFDTKIAQIEKELYGGKVVNAREVENLGKEIASFKKRRSDMDERLLELMDLVPPAKALSDAIEKEIANKKRDLIAHQKEAMATRASLEQQFKEVSAKRGEAAALVPKPFLLRYDAIRQKVGGIGMSEVVRGGFCGMCGTHLPEKLIEGAREGRITTCESCHRILYASEGIV